MILLDYFKTALKPSVLKLLAKVFVTALFPIKKTNTANSKKYIWIKK